MVVIGPVTLKELVAWASALATVGGTGWRMLIRLRQQDLESARRTARAEELGRRRDDQLEWQSRVLETIWRRTMGSMPPPRARLTSLREIDAPFAVPLAPPERSE
jgi:hypothetical protein